MADIFSEDQTDINTTDPTKDYLEELVGDGKKFSDTKALARGKIEADLFIERIKQDNAELREELKQKVALQEVLDQLKGMRNEPNREESHTPPEDGTKSLTPVTPEELEALLDKKLNERQSQSTLLRNQDYVQAELKKVFGSEDIVRSEINRKAKELDIKPEVLRQMAQQTPKAFLALVIQDRSTPVSTPRSSVSLGTFKPVGQRTKAQWDELRKRDPLAYHSKEQTIERHNDAVKLGEAFFT